MTCVLLSCSLSIHAQIEATTTDGRKIQVFDDGTWKPAPAASANQNTKDEFNFRKTKWGFSPESVKKSEDSEPELEKNGNLLYSDSVSGLRCLVAYVFADNKLVRAKYKVVEEHTNKNDYIYDFNALKSALSEKYGAQKEGDTLWKNSLYKDKPEHYGIAIGIGHLVYYAKWQTPDTDIAILLNGDNYEVSLAIEYSSRKLSDLETAAQGKAVKDKL